MLWWRRGEGEDHRYDVSWRTPKGAVTTAGPERWHGKQPWARSTAMAITEPWASLLRTDGPCLDRPARLVTGAIRRGLLGIRTPSTHKHTRADILSPRHLLLRLWTRVCKPSKPTPYCPTTGFRTRGYSTRHIDPYLSYLAAGPTPALGILSC